MSCSSDDVTKIVGKSYIVVAKMIKHLSRNEKNLSNEKKYEKYHFHATQFCEKTGDIAYEFKTNMRDIYEKNPGFRFYINEYTSEILSTHTPKNIKEIIIEHLNSL